MDMYYYCRKCDTEFECTEVYSNAYGDWDVCPYCLGEDYYELDFKEEELLEDE
jgi:hypothetical protein